MELLTQQLVRPRRCAYSLADLGPASFRIHGVIGSREDFVLRNSRGLRLECSWYYPLHNTPLPCVIYGHGNCGSRLDAADIVRTLLPLGISVATLDFAGSGLSEGEFVSLGYYEKEDIGAIVEYMRQQRRVKTIVLWGRSMGAVAALLYASEDLNIAFLVLDSPFASLTELIKEQTSRLQWLPSGLSSPLVRQIRKVIAKTVHFDIEAVCPLLVISKCKAPCAFIHAADDVLISIRHSQRLLSLYPNQSKSLHRTTGGHNSARDICLLELMARKVHEWSGTAPFYREKSWSKKSLLTLARANRMLEEMGLSPRTAHTTARSVLTVSHSEKTIS